MAFAAGPGFPERLLPLALDVTDESGLLGAVEEASAAEVEAVFTTNAFGLLNVTRAVLPHMREEHSGHVVNISSMGGFAQVAGWGGVRRPSQPRSA